MQLLHYDIMARAYITQDCPHVQVTIIDMDGEKRRLISQEKSS